MEKIDILNDNSLMLNGQITRLLKVYKLQQKQISNLVNQVNVSTQWKEQSVPISHSTKPESIDKKKKKRKIRINHHLEISQSLEISHPISHIRIEVIMKKLSRLLNLMIYQLKRVKRQIPLTTQLIQKNILLLNLNKLIVSDLYLGT